MKVAIVGAGVSGSYLLSRLEGHDVKAFELSSREEYDPVCAWGTSRYAMKEFSKRVGLNFEDYILHVGEELVMDLRRIGKGELRLKLSGLCTFDKRRYQLDLLKGRDVEFGKRFDEGEYDLVIDATGVSRAMLPKVEDLLVPCYQYLVKFREPPFDDFRLTILETMTGYLWYFPLGGNLFHVGGGDVFGRHKAALDEFVKKHGGEVLKASGKAVRITPPELAQPFYSNGVVGVGEAIGTVHPIFGEGIIPSLQSSELLVEHLFDLEGYRKAVIKKFAPFKSPFKVVKAFVEGNFSFPKMLKDLVRMFVDVKLNEKRYGVRVGLEDMLLPFKRP